MSKTTTSILLCLFFLTATVTAHGFDGHKCTHDTDSHPKPELADVEEAYPPKEGDRLLASYNNIRMKAYYGNINAYSADYQPYLQTRLIPPIMDYFQATLKVKYPITSPIKFTTSQICSIPTPDEIKVGLSNVDLYWIMDLSTDTAGSWVASSYACYLASGSKRPYIAKTTINTAMFVIPDDTDVIRHEKNMICIMHELVHNLGFSSSLYQYFLDADGVKLTNASFSTPFLDSTTKVLDVEPLTSMLKTHFGCPTLAGAYLENTGSDATAASHFERRQFGFEFMTSGNVLEMQVSKFTLALLEGSGWYVPDYTMADNFYWGQGQGCNFLLQSCSDSTFNFAEFCSDSARGCANPGRGGGFCSTDARSDGCRFVHPNPDYDCEDPDSADNARLPEIQMFGRGAGSKCFTGTLSSTSSTSSRSSFCLKYACSGSGTSTKLTVTMGTKSVTCTQAGAIGVTGYKGTFDCPDPLTFCSTVAVKSCPRGCMGRGNCNSGVCVCNAGYSGKDCALNS